MGEGGLAKSSYTFIVAKKAYFTKIVSKKGRGGLFKQPEYRHMGGRGVGHVI